MIKHQILHPLMAVFAAASLLALPMSVSADLNIDFSRKGPLQAGYEAFDHATDGGSQVTKTFSNPLGASGTIDVTISGNTHFRSYVAATGIFGAQSDLLRDGPLCNDVCDLNLGLNNLRDGTYEITMYHHTTQLGPSNRALDVFNVRLTDGLINDDVLVNAVKESDNASNSLATTSVAFVVVNGSPVNIVLDRPVNTAGMHITLAGFDLAVVPEPNTGVLLGMGAMLIVPLFNRKRRRTKE